MKGAVVRETGNAPGYVDFDEPVPGEGEVRIHVTASALTNFVKLRALGKHYSFTAKPPFVVGIDGIGTLDDGQRVYFLFPRQPFGGMAERTVVARAQCLSVPDGVDDVSLAALADPGMSAWVALQMRAKIQQGETVLINGATGSAGRVAVQITKHLGAGRVIATGRNREVLDRLTMLGADATVVLDQAGHASAEEWQHHFADGVDIVLDYLWGPSALQIIEAARSGHATKRIRFIQLGLSGGTSVNLPGALLRASAIEIMGSGAGSVPEKDIVGCISQLMNAAPVIGFDLATTTMPLSQIEEAWSASDTQRRIVLAPNVKL
ncbi:quinone oxidoreductase family protein [Pleomorphomonas koreensis]|uniref:quinone oxidoreductase family protein n=1 Tax=Pleomorphomonas koreensis TaxID=257440 RepID=UPI00047A8C58|nr:zinc-binding alcohol dehydrogenase family protein [Pleomorphomonas koreensis]